MTERAKKNVASSSRLEAEPKNSEKEEKEEATGGEGGEGKRVRECLEEEKDGGEEPGWPTGGGNAKVEQSASA